MKTKVVKAEDPHKRTLLEMVDDSRALTALIVESEGEITETLEQFIDEITTNLSSKVDRCFHAKQSLKDFSERAKEMSAKWKALEHGAKGAIERLENNMKFAMLAGNLTEIDGFEVTVKIGDAPKSVVIKDETLIPDEYFEVKRQVSKTLIKEALKAGKDVSGASLESVNKTLRMKLNKKIKGE